MGTNYYLRNNICEKCDLYDELHIGKSSAGWRFSFRAYLDPDDVPDGKIIQNIYDWKRVIDQEDCQIFDEYGDFHTKESFYSLVTKKSGLKSHAQYVLDNSDKYPAHAKDNWSDELGNSFTNNEFS